MTSNAKLAEVTARIAPRSRDGLTPALTVLQDRGYKLAPAPDGGIPGASGRLRAVIPVSPDALSGGPLSRLADGDIIASPQNGERWTRNSPLAGREHFARNRAHAAMPESGAHALFIGDGA